MDPYTDEELAHLVEQEALDIPQFNRRRAMRALEIAHFGQGFGKSEGPYVPLITLLWWWTQSIFMSVINRRVDLMFEAGLLDEAKWLFDHYPDVQAVKGIGYKEPLSLFSWRSRPLRKVSESLKQATRRFANVSWPGSVIVAGDFYQIGAWSCKTVFEAR